VNQRNAFYGQRNGILSVGRLVPKKGFDVLLDALALFPAAQRPRVTIVGDGPERTNLQRLADSLGLDSHVHFCGWLPNDQVKNLLRRSTMCVLPCRVDSDGDRDGIPVALMEAMAEGVPVITGDLPAIRELIQNGENGILLPPDDVFGLADAIRELSSRPGLRERLGRAGRERVQEEFALDTNLDRLLNAFQATHGDAAFPTDEFAVDHGVAPIDSANLDWHDTGHDEDAPPRSSRNAIRPNAA
jgi:glycosyltransferase involved in cell wall biosynthesis